MRQARFTTKEIDTMVFYHGTTQQKAEQIIQGGFLPEPPSRAVWFTTDRHYATAHAQGKAGERRERPVVLACELELEQLNLQMTRKCLVGNKGVIAIKESVPAAAIRWYEWVDLPSSPEALKARMKLAHLPSSPEHLTMWLNQLFQLKPHERISPRNPGIQRLSHWMVQCMKSGIKRTSIEEILQKARQWLPDIFDGIEIKPEPQHRRITVQHTEQETEMDTQKGKLREEEAMQRLDSPNPKRRIRGLKLLLKLGNEDIFDWCVLLLDDDSKEVVIAALQTMVRCDAVDCEEVRPYVHSADKRIRASAIAVLAKHGGQEARYWLEKGFKAKEVCMRLAVAALLPELDPSAYPELFDLAQHDSNPEVKRLASKANRKTRINA